MIIAKLTLFLLFLLILSSCASDRFRYAVLTPKDGESWTDNQIRQTGNQLGYDLTSQGFTKLDCLKVGYFKHRRKQIRYGRPISEIHYRSKAVSGIIEWQEVEKRGGIGVSFDSTLKKIVVSQSVTGPGYHEETLKVVRLVENVLTQQLGLGSYKVSFENEGIFVFDPI